MNMPSLSLKGMITLLVLLLVLPFGCIVIVSAYMDASQQMAAATRHAFEQKLENLSLEIQRNLRKGDQAAVTRALSLAGVDTAISHLSLINAQGVIIDSTRYAWKGRSAASVLEEFDLKQFRRVVQKRGTLFVDDAAHIDFDGYYAVELAPSGQHSQPPVGAFFGEYRYGQTYQDMKV
ncbi:MAG: hypothetical protein R8K50_04050, partial [Mariprofundus sp.]